MNRNNRGQISSFDALLALIIFILIFAVLRGIWIDSTTTALTNFEYMEMQIKAEQAIDSLIKTSGYPEDWTPSNVELIGLAEKPGSLNSNKVDYFFAMDYNTAISKLGLGKYSVQLDLNSVLPNKTKKLGAITGTNKNIISIKKIVIYSGGEASVTIKVTSN